MTTLQAMAIDVERFNREIIGLPIPETPTRLCEERKKHAYDHIREELDEFWGATTLEAEADAMMDLAYVSLGRLIEMGIPVGAMFEEIQRANMERVRGGNARRPHALGFDAVKPPGWKPPDLLPYLTMTKEEAVAACKARSDKGIYIGLTRAIHESRRKPKILVMGYGRHGKDTVAEMLRKDYGLSFTSSSWFCAETVVMPYVLKKYGKTYASVKECYEDRHNGHTISGDPEKPNRAVWYDAITEFNRPDASQLGRGIFGANDIYCGLRSSREFHAVKAARLYDLCIWVDASGRGIPVEDRSSCTVEPWMADVVIDNGGDKKELTLNLNRVMWNFFRMSLVIG